MDFGTATVEGKSHFGTVAWPPPDIDARVPPVSAGVSCVLPDVLHHTGLQAREFVANLERFTATEHVEHWQFDRNGQPRWPQSRTFSYLVIIKVTRPGWFSVEESRDGGFALDRFPEQLATLGLPALALLCHPWYADEFQITCEGLSEWQDRPAWQVRFEQRPDRPARMRGYRIGNTSYPVKLKGRAWVAADTFQVMHLDSDLAEPIAKIKLACEHISIDYHPIQFKSEELELWLPRSADIYFDFRGRRHHRCHTFSDYLLFSVDTLQHIAEPIQP